LEPMGVSGGGGEAQQGERGAVAAPHWQKRLGIRKMVREVQGGRKVLNYFEELELQQVQSKRARHLYGKLVATLHALCMSHAHMHAYKQMHTHTHTHIHTHTCTRTQTLHHRNSNSSNTRSSSRKNTHAHTHTHTQTHTHTHTHTLTCTAAAAAAATPGAAAERTAAGDL
jgi:hypothetical protein